MWARASIFVQLPVQASSVYYGFSASQRRGIIQRRHTHTHTRESKLRFFFEHRSCVAIVAILPESVE